MQIDSVWLMSLQINCYYYYYYYMCALIRSKILRYGTSQ
jgi:hypothetical protein